MKRMKRVVGFGDFLLRLSPPGCVRFVQTTRFNSYYTGAEANACVSLAVMGCDAAFVTRVPDNPFGHAGLNELRRRGVDVSNVVFGGNRLGIFFLEKGASQRPSSVVYDRQGTGVTTARRGDFDWPRILKGAGYFLFTGITAGLGGELPRILEDACRAARRMGVEIVCDLNYRSKLWTVEAAARTMPRLVRSVDHLLANAWDARNLLGVETPDDPVVACARMKAAYPKLKTVAMTFRQAPNSSDNTLSALLHVKGRAYRSRSYPMHLVDRVGGGDGFTAGLIYALGRGFAPQRAIEYATAAACLKHSIELDVNLATVAEIEGLLRRP